MSLEMRFGGKRVPDVFSLLSIWVGNVISRDFFFFRSERDVSRLLETRDLVIFG